MFRPIKKAIVERCHCSPTIAFFADELAEFQPDAIMCRTEPITAKMMDTCKNLKVIGKQGASE